MKDRNDDASDQTGPAVWGDEPTPVVPPLRTFKVTLARWPADETVYVDAHSVTCLDDAAHFYVYRPTSTAEGVVLAAYAVRTLRPYLDVEDVTQQLAVTSNKLN